MKNQTLYIFTHAYPFGYGEPFLHAELPYLKKEFERVVVIPTNSDEHKRTMPAGIELDLRFQKILLKTPVGRFLSGLGQLFSSENFREAKVLMKKSGTTGYAWYKLMNTIYYAKALEVFVRDFLIPQGQNAVYYSYWGSFHTVGMTWSKKNHPELKTVCRLHRSDLYEYAASGRYIPFRPGDLQALDKIVPIANEGLDYLKKTYQQPFANAEIHRLGVPDQPGKNPDPVAGFPHHFVSCSGLSEVKRVHLIIHAMAELHKQGLEFKWTHFGDGPLSTELKEMAKNNLPENKVDFRGQMSNRNVMGFYQRNSVDLFLNASSSEGIPVSIMEAFSVGIPVVAPPVGGIREIVDHQKNGYLIDVEPSPADIARAVLKVIKNPDYSSFRESAYKKWESSFRAKTNFTEFAKMMANLG